MSRYEAILKQIRETGTAILPIVWIVCPKCMDALEGQEGDLCSQCHTQCVAAPLLSNSLSQLERVRIIVMKVWHDDIRPAPEGWVWARTNEQARELLENNDVTTISLDHDLGLDHVSEQMIEDDPELLFLAGNAEDTGLNLVNWMIETNNVPETVIIHSWNPAGAAMMANRFRDSGHWCVVSPFKIGDN